MAAITTTPALEVSKICVLIPINIVPIKDAPVPTMQRLSQRKNRLSISESLIYSERVHLLWELC